MSDQINWSYTRSNLRHDGFSESRAGSIEFRIFSKGDTALTFAGRVKHGYLLSIFGLGYRDIAICDGKSVKQLKEVASLLATVFAKTDTVAKLQVMLSLCGIHHDTVSMKDLESLRDAIDFRLSMQSHLSGSPRMMAESGFEMHYQCQGGATEKAISFEPDGIIFIAEDEVVLDVVIQGIKDWLFTQYCFQENRRFNGQD